MDSVVISLMKLGAVVISTGIVFYRFVLRLKYHRKFRELSFIIGMMSAELGIGLTILYLELLVLTHVHYNIITIMLSFFWTCSLLFLVASSIFYPKNYKKTIAPIITMALVMGIFLGLGIARIIGGAKPFYLMLLTGDDYPTTLKEIIMGLVITTGGILLLGATTFNAKKFLDLVKNTEFNKTTCFLLSSEGCYSSVFVLFGMSLITRYAPFILLLQVIMILTILSITLLALHIDEKKPIPFTSFLRLKQALLSSNPNLGWVLYVFGHLGPEPLLANINNIADLPNKDRMEFLIEMGIKSMSLMTFGDHLTKPSIKMKIQEPFQGVIFYIAGLGRTKNEDDYDYRFEGHPYVGFLVISRYNHSWIFDNTSLWEEFFEKLMDDYFIEEITQDIVNSRLIQLLYSIIVG